jgi:hypothetical protein
VGQDPLAETRVEISGQRAELERTADQLFESLDLRRQFQRNPVPFVAVGAGAVFLLAGGPSKMAGLVRRQFFPSSAEKAYDSLPKPMQSWVDHMAGAVGPRTAEARETLAKELHRWRSDPRAHGKISKKLAKQIAEGPPGPRRAGWNAVEAGAAILMTALARKAVERFLAGEPPIGNAVLDAAGTAGGAAQPDAGKAKRDVARSASERVAAASEDYSGMSSTRVP